MTASQIEPRDDLELSVLTQQYSAHGVSRLFIKTLAANDNSKNQPYLGQSFEVLQMLPPLDVHPDRGRGGVTQNFKAKLNFRWMDEQGSLFAAPDAQLILYPDYPEVRFSGFLNGCAKRPSKLMTSREAGRVLIFGVTAGGVVIGTVFSSSSAVSAELSRLTLPIVAGVFRELTLIEDTRQQLLDKLSEIWEKKWIGSKRLSSSGEILPCLAPQCGGYTLEAELGVRPNSFSKPDYLGWEIKQHDGGGRITLMTPEPTGGVYHDAGFEEFIRRFGYPDRKGIPDRMNFGGLFKAGKRNEQTGVTLVVSGYDDATGKVDVDGAVQLLSDDGCVAASWAFSHLMRIWSRKHEKAAYVESVKRNEPTLAYAYGPKVGLGIGTDFRRFLHAVAAKHIAYDPGLKLENCSGTHPKAKKRSQFRVNRPQVPDLYSTFEIVDLRAYERSSD